MTVLFDFSLTYFLQFFKRDGLDVIYSSVNNCVYGVGGERISEMTVEKLLTEVQVQKICSLFVLAALRRNGEERINASLDFFFFNSSSLPPDSVT